MQAQLSLFLPQPCPHPPQLPRGPQSPMLNSVPPLEQLCGLSFHFWPETSECTIAQKRACRVVRCGLVCVNLLRNGNGNLGERYMIGRPKRTCHNVPCALPQPHPLLYHGMDRGAWYACLRPYKKQRRIISIAHFDFAVNTIARGVGGAARCKRV